MRALFLTLAPIALGWFAMEVRSFLARRKQELEKRERDSRRHS